MEDAFGVQVSGPLRALRRLLYCGEWIESHVLHVYMLHAPDFLGYEGAIEMAKDHRSLVESALRMKKTGNEIVRTLGGREIHPINVRVGGFYKVPSRRDLRGLRDNLKWARDAALESVRWTAGLDFPDFERRYEFVALHDGEQYPMNEGRIVSSAGLDIAVGDYDNHFEEIHVAHSNALHAVIRGRGHYFVGPLARFNLNSAWLSDLAREAAREVGFEAPCNNPFMSIVARSVEVLHAFDEALRLIEGYEPPDRPAVDLPVRAGVGHGCTEAPRGILYHRYRLADDGTILDAKIVPPTSQNQPTIEDDLRDLATRYVDLPDDRLRWKCEQSIRNYDPCISCATHFLKLQVDRA
jgi:coenzyme F420-reducing hydrogenase alpha subunit